MRPPVPLRSKPMAVLLVLVLASGLLGAMDGAPTPAVGAAFVHEFAPR